MKTIKSYSKINLGLYVTNKRTDGYHNLHSVFVEIDLFDTIQYEINSDYSISFNTNHLLLRNEPSNTLLSLVDYLQKFKRFGINIYLEKKIPDQAGLGGGSANAAYLLKELHNKIHQSLTDDQLMSISEKIGSDVPFFLYGGIAEISGRGEKVNPISMVFPYHIVLIKKKNLSFSTQKIFAKFSKTYSNNNKHTDITNFINKPTRENLIKLKNELEIPVNEISGEILKMKSILKSHGAFYTSMTGSGSVVYGLFDEVPKLTVNDNYQIIHCKANI